MFKGVCLVQHPVFVLKSSDLEQLIQEAVLPQGIMNARADFDLIEYLDFPSNHTYEQLELFKPLEGRVYEAVLAWYQGVDDPNAYKVGFWGLDEITQFLLNTGSLEPGMYLITHN